MLAACVRNLGSDQGSMHGSSYSEVGTPSQAALHPNRHEVVESLRLSQAQACQDRAENRRIKASSIMVKGLWLRALRVSRSRVSLGKCCS